MTAALNNETLKLMEGDFMAAKKEESKLKTAPDASTKSDLIIHTVSQGDTLRSISQKYLGTPKRAHEIRIKNNLATDILRVGRKLVIPNK
jgi:LysM repeat protein